MNSINIETKEVNNKILETKSYKLSLQNEEYELTMNLTEAFIEFKLIPKLVSDFNYKSKITLSIIKENKYLIKEYTELKKAYEVFDKKFIKKKIKLIKLKEDSINLNYINNVDDEEEVEVNIELKKFKIEKGDEYPMIRKKIEELEKEISELKKNLSEVKNEMDKKIELTIEAYLKKKKEEEEIKKQKEEEIKKKRDEEIKKQIENKLALNDNVNYLNDFQCDNFDNAIDVNYISNGRFNLNKKMVAVYPIIRNNESIYELACPKYGNNTCNIDIYNILLNKKTNQIYKVNGIINIKHYYSSSSKKHFLLTSNYDYNIKIWNITQKIITKELDMSINPETDKQNYISSNCSCLLFKNDDYFILGGGSKSEYGYNSKIFNKGGNLIKYIGGSKLEYVDYIEAAYKDDKPYVLLSGSYHAESYDYDNGNIIEYRSKGNEKIQATVVNLFNKNNNLYLLCGYNNGNISVFNFDDGIEINSIKVGNSNIYGLCSFNEKYFLFGNNKEINVINFDNEKKIKKINIKGFKSLDVNEIYGIEKIKIADKGEFIISYSQNIISIWKLSN